MGLSFLISLVTSQAQIMNSQLFYSIRGLMTRRREARFSTVMFERKGQFKDFSLIRIRIRNFRDVNNSNVLRLYLMTC